jgi:hypothetical protein
LQDNIKALRVINVANYRKIFDPVVGPRYANFDMWRQQSWEIHSHGGFAMYPYHHGGGLCTYLHAQSGARLFTFITPDLKDYGDREDLFEAMDQLSVSGQFGHFKQNATMLLEPGSLL